MKKGFIIGAVLLVTTAIIFAIPVIPVPVQHIETYTENEIKQEPYVVKEKQDVSVPHTLCVFKSRQVFTEKTNIVVFGFIQLPIDRVCTGCTCDTADRVGHVSIYPNNYICIPSDAKIRVTWTVDESERGNAFDDNLRPCTPRFAFSDGGGSTYWDQSSWEGELESPAAILPVFFYLQFGYVNNYCNKMPPINYTVDIIWYTSQTVDKDVTKYRDVQAQVQRQRIVTEYQKVSVWQRIFAK